MQQTVRVAAAQAESAWRRASCAASSPSCRPGSSASWPGWPVTASTASPNSPRCSPSPAPPCTAHSSAASPTRRADSQPADQHVGFPMPPQPAPEPTASTDRTRAVPEGEEHHRGRGNGGTHPCGQPGQRCTLLCMSQKPKRTEAWERSRPRRQIRIRRPDNGSGPGANGRPVQETPGTDLTSRSPNRGTGSNQRPGPDWASYAQTSPGKDKWRKHVNSLFGAIPATRAEPAVG